MQNYIGIIKFIKRLLCKFTLNILIIILTIQLSSCNFRNHHFTQKNIILNKKTFIIGTAILYGAYIAVNSYWVKHFNLGINNFLPEPYILQTSNECFGHCKQEEWDNFGDIQYLTDKYCCVMPTSYDRQELWKIGFENWFNHCDNMFLFIDQEDFGGQKPEQGSIIDSIYKPLNIYKRSKAFKYKWLLKDIISIPTLFDPQFDQKKTSIYKHKFNVTKPPFPINSSFWIIPTNSFINNELIINLKYWNKTVPKYGRLNLFDKTASMNIYIYLRHLNECDWILRVEDDLIFDMPRMKEYLSFYNYNVDHYFGANSGNRRERGGEVWFSCGGYIISKSTLIKVVSNPCGLLNMKYGGNRFPAKHPYILNCSRGNYDFDDALMGACIRNAGIIEDCFTKSGSINTLQIDKYLNQSNLDKFNYLIYKMRSNNHLYNYLEYHGIKIILLGKNFTEKIIKNIINIIEENDLEINKINITEKKSFLKLPEKPYKFNKCRKFNKDSHIQWVNNYINKTSLLNFCEI